MKVVTVQSANWSGNDVRVADKASDTIHELRRILDREPVVGSASAVWGECRDNGSPLVEHCDYSYGAAGHRLRNMLADVPQPPPAKTVLFEQLPRVTISLTCYWQDCM